MDKEKRKSIFGFPRTAKKARQLLFSSTPAAADPYSFVDESDDEAGGTMEEESETAESSVRLEFVDIQDEDEERERLMEWRPGDPIPADLDGEFVHEMEEINDMLIEERLMELGQGDDEFVRDYATNEGINNAGGESNAHTANSPPEKDDDDDEGRFLLFNLMLTNKSTFDQSGVESDENYWSREYFAQLDDRRQLRWTVDPPSEEDAAGYRLPQKSPDRIRLSAKGKHLIGQRNPVHFFDVVFPDRMLQNIITYTNKLAEATVSNWKRVDLVEMKAFIGALLYCGERNLGYESLDDMFKTNSYSVHIPIRRAFGRNRFKNILRFLRFDDKLERTTIDKKNRIAKIQEVFATVVRQCRELVEPGKTLTVDESMISYEGRVSFKQYNPMKSDAYGMKVWCLCDVETGALVNAQAYTGKVDDKPEKDQGRRVVKDMVEPYIGTGRIITTDRFFSSVTLAEELRANGLEFVGTLQVNRTGVPVQFQNVDLFHHYDRTAKKKAAKKSSEPKSNENKTRRKGKPDAVTGDRHSEMGSSPANTAIRPPAPIRILFRRSNNGQLEIRSDENTGAVSTSNDDDATHADSIDTAIGEVMKISVLSEIGQLLPQSTTTNKKKKKDKFNKDIDPKSAFLFSDHLTLAKYEPKKGKRVFVLSTIHHEPAVSNDSKLKPAIILFYNKSKIGVDLLDQKVKNYSTVRSSHRWPVRFFLWIIDIGVITAHTVYALANPDLPESETNRRKFLQRLAWQLMKPQARRRESDPNVHRFIRATAKLVYAARQLDNVPDEFLDDSLPLEQTLALSQTPQQTLQTKKKIADKYDDDGKIINRRKAPRCYVETCKRIGRKGYRQCFRCGKPVCGEHRKPVIVGGKTLVACLGDQVAYCNGTFL